MAHKKNPSDSEKLKRGYPRTGSKEFTIIQHLLLGNSLHRFEAEGLGDHCLPSTISIIARKYDLDIPRKMVQVPNRFNSDSSVMCYWFSKEDRIKINSLR
jgi:hypothetical protein